MNSQHHPAGLSDAQTRLVQGILHSYLKRFGKSKIFYFGSRATGKHRKYSDLDLWIETEIPLITGDIEELNAHFVDSDLPITVDIVTPQTCLQDYKAHIMAEKIFWFELNDRQ